MMKMMMRMMMMMMMVMVMMMESQKLVAIDDPTEGRFGDRGESERMD